MLHPYQQEMVSDALSFLQDGQGSRLYYGPTGCGKSYIEAAVLDRSPGCHLLAPTPDIATGIWEKLTGKKAEGSEQKTRDRCESCSIFTTVRYRNLIDLGKLPLPQSMIFDEAHHTLSSTNRELWSMAGKPVRVGFTATPYRGNPKETESFLSSWGEPVPIITLSDAIDQGYISRPTFSVWPLMNDDLIDVVSGEFQVRQVDGMVKGVMGDLVSRIAQFFNGVTFDRPTTIVAPSVASVHAFLYALRDAGLPCIGVTGEGVEHDDTKTRRAAFDKVIARTHLLVQVRVVGEGVDLPLRRMIDCSPTMSPLLWMQRVGRITRPTGYVSCPACHGCRDGGPECPLCHDCGTRPEPPPEYITTCHNLTRHAYLWQGIIPASEIRNAQRAWGPEYTPKRRSLCRAIGLEGLGRFTVSQIPLKDGLTGLFYGLQAGDDKYAVFVHPCDPDPLFFHRRDGWKEEMQTIRSNTGEPIEVRKRDYGKWTRIDKLPDLTDCSSLPPMTLSPGQHRWWTHAAGRYGLDGTASVNARVFQILPILQDCKLRIQTQE